MYGIGAQLMRRVAVMAPFIRRRHFSGKKDPYKFKFNAENKERIKVLLSYHPKEEQRAALVPLLDLAQRQYGWLPLSAMDAVSKVLNIAPFVVYEVAYFYHMFHLQPRGKYIFNVCTSTPCYLRGSDKIMETCKSTLNLDFGETSKDMNFSLLHRTCCGACINAPVLTINDDLFEDLNPSDIKKIVEKLKCGQVPQSGPQNGRFASEPLSGLTSLKSKPPPPGYKMRDLCED